MPTAEFNYSRIISSTAKYKLEPVAYEPGQQAKIGNYKAYVYIEPEIQQLPNRKELLDILSKGKNVSIFFEFHQATDPEIQNWISQLGLLLQKSSGMSMSEDRQNTTTSILLKREMLLSKSIGLQSIAKQSSRLKAEYGDMLVQVYSLRPSTFPRTSGMLSISFAASQFSDDALGDVWEGKYCL